ncbi:MAG: hypothetical protein ABIK30_13435, partial [bacterium]
MATLLQSSVPPFIRPGSAIANNGNYQGSFTGDVTLTGGTKASISGNVNIVGGKIQSADSVTIGG